MSARISEAPPSSGAASEAPPRRRQWLERAASIGTSAQAAIPGAYAWSVTVAPAAWSFGAPVVAKVLAVVGVLALVSAPLLEGGELTAHWLPASLVARRGPALARAWSVWGFVGSSVFVWLLVPTALSPLRLDELRGGLGMVGWALFAFASAGPVLRSDPAERARVVASTSLKPRSELPRGDGLYVTVGVLLALALQAIGWDVAVPERAVLVRLVTILCGMAVLGATTSIALARHATRTATSRRIAVRRSLPWLVLLAVFTVSATLLKMAH